MTTSKEYTGASTDLVQFEGVVHPIKTDVVDFEVPEGLTILDLLTIAQPNTSLLREAVVMIDDSWEVPRDKWHLVRPRAGHKITARVLPVPRGGGGGGGGKSPTRTILTIAVIAASFFLGPALGAAMGFSQSAVIMGQTINLASAVGGALISVAGTLLINTIAPVKPPKMGQLSGYGATTQESPSLFIEGSRNRTNQFGTVPAVLGFIRYKPPKAAKTYTELLGDSNVLRDLFAIGYGRLEMSEWKIGNTPIENFSNYELEVREGVSGDAALTTYPGTVSEEQFSIKLAQTSGWQTRTSSVDVDELGVDITFPRGCVVFGSGGSRSNHSVTMELEWREVGSGTWLPLPAGVVATFDTSWISGSSITFTHARSVAIRHGIRWPVPSRGQYEVQVRRITTDTDSTSIFDELFWATLRGFKNEDPIAFRFPLAKAGLKIQSTDQLNGVVDELSTLAKTVCLDWDSGTTSWVERATNNPASLFRLVAQGDAGVNPWSDSQVDLVRLQEWHDFCVTNGFTFNMVRDFQASKAEVLSDIAAAGRAGLTLEDGKWSVVIDQPQDYAITHVTPRNSYNFEAEKTFLDLPHAWRIRFQNENVEFKQDERIVYRPGYDSTNATKFESIEFPGVTNPDHVWKMGIFHMQQILLRPERWTVYQDFEYLVARRGRRVKLTHDVLLIGLASGRIKSMVTDGSGNVTSITVDEELEMSSGTSYGLVVRRDVVGDVSLSVPIDTVAGTNTTVTPTTPIPAASVPEVGDLFSFGELGQETEDALVLSVEHHADFTGKITMVPYRTELYDYDGVTPPTYTPKVTETTFLSAPVVEQVVTDESVLERGTGSATLVRAEVRVTPIDDALAFLEVQQRLTGTGEPYYNSQVSSRTDNAVRVGDVSQGETYDFRVRWNKEGFLPGPWTEAPGIRISGRSTPPSALSGMTISAFGGQAHIRWDEPPELDVRFGGTVKFRHSSLLSGAEWSDSISIGDVSNANSLFVSLPLKPGTYIARVFDSDGNPSLTTTSVSTKQASTLQYANVTSIDEAPNFAGTHDGTIVKGSLLEMQGAGLFDDIADLDSVSNLDYYGGAVTTATYDFSVGIDLGSVQRVRLTSRVTGVVENVLETIDDRTELMDEWEDFDGTLQAQADAQVWVRHTDDDPAGTPTWSQWFRLDSAEFEQRGFEFQLRLFSYDPAYDIHISELGIDAESVV